MRLLSQPERRLTLEIQRIIRAEGCRDALDVGAGEFSNLFGLRGELDSTAIDAYGPAIEKAQQARQYAEYVHGDIMTHDFGGRQFDAVVANELIEHLDKRAGWELLGRLDQLARKLIIITTPNGFQPQGAEFGNPWQRHRSGWFPDDFRGMGYEVRGVFGPRFLRGYAGTFRWRGAKLWNPISEVFSLTLGKMPRLHYGLLAVKRMGDVPTRLSRG